MVSLFSAAPSSFLLKCFVNGGDAVTFDDQSVPPELDIPGDGVSSSFADGPFI